MATFYLLPPRPFLGQRFASYLGTVFPGLAWSSSNWAQLADHLAAVAVSQPDVFVIYGEELPLGEDPARALADGFGAETGDEVIEVRAEKSGDMTTRHWRFE